MMHKRIERDLKLMIFVLVKLLRTDESQKTIEQNKRGTQIHTLRTALKTDNHSENKTRLFAFK